MLAWHQVKLHLALLCTIGLHHGFITCLQPFTHPFHRSIPPNECLLEQLILLQCNVALQVRGAFDPLYIQPSANAIWKLLKDDQIGLVAYPAGQEPEARQNIWQYLLRTGTWYCSLHPPQSRQHKPVITFNQTIGAGVLWQDGLLPNSHFPQICSKCTLKLTTPISPNYTRCAITAHHLLMQPLCNGGTTPIL